MHVTLADFEGVKTQSEGEGHHKTVAIIPVGGGEVVEPMLRPTPSSRAPRPGVVVPWRWSGSADRMRLPLLVLPAGGSRVGGASAEPAEGPQWIRFDR